MSQPLFSQPASILDDRQPSEYQVKAAFLVNFTRFVEWPSGEAASNGSESPFNICIWGDDPFGGVLDQTVQGESVNGRTLAVLRLHNSTEKLGSCRILFVGKGDKEAKVLASAGKGLLTIGESETFLREGGVLAFVLQNRRVRFEINLKAASSASLQISSRLLAVASRVEK